MGSQHVFYLMSGEAHLPYLAVSLWTLRHYYQGPITIYAWPESYRIAQQIVADPRLFADGLRAEIYQPPYRTKNAQFCQKQLIAQGVEAERVIYLDADTTIHGSLDPLFAALDQTGFVATQFGNWMSNEGLPRKRIERLKEFGGIPSHLIDNVTLRAWPSLNGGVWACLPGTEVLRTWYEWTRIAVQAFIADEAVLHVLQPKYCPRGMMAVMEGGKWNCSARNKFTPPSLKDEDIVIRHYHGDSNCRPMKCPEGFALWGKLYRQCRALNMGGLADWRAEITSNKYLDRCDHANWNLEQYYKEFPK